MTDGQTALDLSGATRERPVERVNVGPALARDVGPRYPALTRGLDPDTSRAAAAKQRGGAEAEIMRVFRSAPHRGGLTDDEIATRLSHLHAPTVKSARTRLHMAGVLVDSGLRRPSLRGSQMIAWRLA